MNPFRKLVRLFWQQARHHQLSQLLVATQFEFKHRRLSTDASNALSAALAESFAVEEANIKVQLVGPSWGDEVTQNAIRALIVFLVLVAIFLSIYFEWQMAIAALVALLTTF
jgi:preprotein translocase subunit SecF